MEWRYPAASWRPLSGIDETEPLVNPRGWVLHTTGSDGSPWAGREGSPGPDRRFCHLWISSAGEIQQFQRLDRAARAQGAGDRSWWSVEAEGHSDEPLTGHQLDALASWHRWCGARDTIAIRPTDGGIGIHSMGGCGWVDQDCPGAVRSSQRRQIIDRAQTLRELDRARQENAAGRRSSSGGVLPGVETKHCIDSVDEISTGRAAEWIHIEMMRVRRRLEELEDQLNEMGAR
jgi:hypothetical protein